MRLATAFFTLVLFAGPCARADCPERTAIVPIGDSITQADREHASYRRPLQQRLRALAIAGDFVGSRTAHFGGPPPQNDFDPDHEGYWGERADQVVGRIRSSRTQWDANIALIHLGHNDMFQRQDVPSTLDDLYALAGLLREDCARIALLFAAPIRARAGGDAWFDELVRGLERLATELRRPDAPAAVVDLRTGFDPGRMTYDGTHPNAEGEAAMAEAWAGAIARLVAEPPDAGVPIVDAGSADDAGAANDAGRGDREPADGGRIDAATRPVGDGGRRPDVVAGCNASGSRAGGLGALLAAALVRTTLGRRRKRAAKRALHDRTDR